MAILNRFLRRYALSDDEQELIASASKSEVRRWRRASMPYLFSSYLIDVALSVAALIVLITKGLFIGIAAVVLAEVVSLLVFAVLLWAGRRSVLETIYTFEGARRLGITPDETEET